MFYEHDETLLKCHIHSSEVMMHISVYSTLHFNQSKKIITSCDAFHQHDRWLLGVDGFDWCLAFTNITNMIIKYNL